MNLYDIADEVMNLPIRLIPCDNMKSYNLKTLIDAFVTVKIK